jgi:hypothetical protein
MLCSVEWSSFVCLVVAGLAGLVVVVTKQCCAILYKSSNVLYGVLLSFRIGCRGRMMVLELTSSSWIGSRMSDL